jgi:hypothetical protein
MIALVMPAHVTIDSGDRIAGYPVLHQQPCHDGRVVVCVRGEQYVQRYVVAWQPVAYRGWCDPVFVERLDVAVEVFYTRAKAALCTSRE